MAGDPKIGEFVFLVILVEVVFVVIMVVFMVIKVMMMIIIIGYKTCEANLASPRCRKECRVLDIRLPFDLHQQQYLLVPVFSSSFSIRPFSREVVKFQYIPTCTTLTTEA